MVPEFTTLVFILILYGIYKQYDNNFTKKLKDDEIERKGDLLFTGFTGMHYWNRRFVLDIDYKTFNVSQHRFKKKDFSFRRYRKNDEGIIFEVAIIEHNGHSWIYSRENYDSESYEDRIIFTKAFKKFKHAYNAHFDYIGEEIRKELNLRNKTESN